LIVPQSWFNSAGWPLGIAVPAAGAVLIGVLLLPARRMGEVITNVAISAGGSWIAAGTRDGRIKVCSLSSTGDCKTVANGGDELNDLQFSPDEHFLVIADENIRLVEIKSTARSSFLRNDKLGYGSMRFNKSGSELVTINSHSRIEVINVRSAVASTMVCCSTFYGEVALLNNDSQIVNAGHWPRVWTGSGKLVKALASNREIETLRPIVVDEAGRRVFMGSQDGRIYAWSVTDFRLITRSPAEADYVDTIALVQGLDLLAYCGFGKQVNLWNPESSMKGKTLSARSSSNLVAMPNKVSIAFGTDSGTIQIWSLKPSPHLTTELRMFQK
jgi:WD40 repeat protein